MTWLALRRSAVPEEDHLVALTRRRLLWVLRNPANRNRAVPLTYDQFRYGFANAVSEEEAKQLYEDFAVATPGKPLFQAATANLNPWTEPGADLVGRLGQAGQALRGHNASLSRLTRMTTSRLEAFSDAVLAIIITIMVLELDVPHEPTLHALAESATGLLTYLLSFVYLGIYWNNHHHLFHLLTG